ncbi:MAG: response regulator transcription factor [Nocardioides sp.]
MTSPTPIRVALVNDYELVVTGLAAVLAPFSERVAVIELDARQPVASDVDLVLYDTFGQAQGAAINISAVLGDSSARVVVFSWNTDPDLVEKALSAGAAAYVAKSVTAEQLVSELERVHSGEVVTPNPSSSQPPTEGRFGRWPGDEVGLSPREAEVLALVCQGLSNQEITDQAYVSINTVKSHIRTLYRKIGVATRSQAVGWGLRNGFSPSSMREVTDDAGA